MTRKREVEGQLSFDMTADPDAYPVPVPARITIALDSAGLYGDDVDRQLGVWESPDGSWVPGTAVDRWEDGTLIPTPEQVAALARLTGHPVEFFYEPVPVGAWSRTFVCDRRRRKHGLTIITSTVDKHGVMRSTYETP